MVGVHLPARDRRGRRLACLEALQGGFPLKILVVDDETEVARLLADVLRQAGHQAVVAHDGPGALAMLDRERPDVVFLDVRMPGMSGIDVLRRIRQADAALPVVLVTAHAGEAEVAEARSLGVSEIVWKPRILANVDEVLGELRAADRVSEESGRVAGRGRRRLKREGSGFPHVFGAPQQ